VLSMAGYARSSGAGGTPLAFRYPTLSSRESQMLAVVVPAHNEQEHIGACLESIRIASWNPRLRGEEVRIVVVLDDCTDMTDRIARGWDAVTLKVASRNVGIARSHGARWAIEAGARWLSFTDADSVVDHDWLVAQLEQGCDAVCGTVQVRDWGDYGAHMQRHYAETYTDADGHRHIHGANLGVTAIAYENAGGFQPLACSEDVALVKALHDSGASIAWSAAPRVNTSARRAFRARGGFGATLARIDREFALERGLQGAGTK
jgi:glycosyltransferase involved in cell wall biosynthesis